MNFRALKGTIMMAVCGAAALFAAGMLLYILVVIFLKGVASLKPHFILFSEINTGMGLGTGIGNAIAGTILLAVTSTIIAIPFGVGTAIYLQKYASDNQFTRFLRLMIEVLSGTPSIVLGIFGVAILVIYLKPITGGESLMAGAIALGILIIPVIERATEDAITRVPCELEEGSYALGATKWLTIRDIVIPYALSGIIVGAILGFGRAAEESAVVLLTAGYSQYMPQFRIALNPNFLLGIKIYPLNDLVGSLPVFLYTSYENSNVFPISSIFAAGFVLIVIVLFINLSAKAILFYATAKTQGHQSGILSLCASFSSRLRRKDSIGIERCTDPGIKGEEPVYESKPFDQPEPPAMTQSMVFSNAPIEPVQEGPQEPSAAKQSPAFNHSTAELLPVVPPERKLPSLKKIITSMTAGIRKWFQSLRQKPPAPTRQTDPAVSPDKKPQARFSLRDFGRTFLLTIAPFALISVLLLILTLALPTLNPVGSNGLSAFVKAFIFTIVLCAICAVISLFLIRGTAMFLLRRKKNPLLGNRPGVFVAIALGICILLIGAFIFSAHLFVPPVSTNPGGQVSSISEISGTVNTPFFSFNLQSGDLLQLEQMNNPLFSFGLQEGSLQLKVMNQTVNTMNLSTPGTGSTPASSPASTSSRDAQLAALLASQNGGGEGSSPTPMPTTASATVTPTLAPAATPPTNPAVPVKNALDMGESYWYGDNSRPCLATVYNTTTLPFYFYWDMDWNRFVQVAPVQTGDVFLVVFIRIEDTGTMRAIVPSADSFIVSYNGQNYTHNVYFDTSVLDQNEIDYYTANFNLLPYQWIREIGQQKRDYAFLTGYNVFGQNTTVISNVSAGTTIPPTGPDTNGQGYFITPGRSNAIDGYLIYEVPASAATDLKDTYVQVSFNSFSPTAWRLGK